MRGPGHLRPEGAARTSNPDAGGATGTLLRNNPRCAPHNQNQNQGLRLGCIPRCSGPRGTREGRLAPTTITQQHPIFSCLFTIPTGLLGQHFAQRGQEGSSHITSIKLCSTAEHGALPKIAVKPLGPRLKQLAHLHCLGS